MQLTTIFVSAVLCLAAILGLRAVAPKLGLMAYPGEHRLHQTPTPMIGGLAILISCLITSVVFGQTGHLDLLLCLLTIGLIGALDDALQLSSVLRFAIQAGIAFLMIQTTGVSLIDLGKLVSDEMLVLGQWELPLTIFATVGVINAINMSDGMDGLAGTLVVIALLFFLMLGADTSPLILVFITCLIVFLAFNSRLVVKQAKVYLGDGGSMMLGLLLAYLFIRHSQGGNAVIQPVTALWFIALPLIDAVSVLIVRPLRGQSPFSADRIHYHHHLLNSGFNVNQTLAIVGVLQIICISIGLALQHSEAPQSASFFGFMGLFLCYLIFLYIRTRKRV